MDSESTGGEESSTSAESMGFMPLVRDFQLTLGLGVKSQGLSLVNK